MVKKQGLTPKQLECIQVMVYEGLSPIEVSKRIKVAFRTVYNWFDDCIFLQEYNKELDKKQASLTYQAMKNLEELMKSNRESIKLKATESVLDRNGRQAKQIQEIEHKGISISIGADED